MKLSRFFVMIILSFVAMFVLMYIMVDKFNNVYLNLDQLYMVLAMTSTMVIIEMIIMGMYDKKTKIIATILGLMVLVVSIFFIRNQTGITDREFLKSMISHHASAILMCTKADIKDTEIQQLCTDILS